MLCPRCGGSVPDDSTYCEYCGTHLVRTESERTPSPGEPSPSESPKRRKHGLYVLAGVLAAVLVLGGSAGAVLLARSGESNTTSDSSSAQAGSDSRSGQTASTQPGVGPTSTLSSSTTAPAQGPMVGPGRWVKVDLAGVAKDIQAVSLTGEALVLTTTSGLYAYLFDTGRIVEIPTERDAGGVDIEGDLVVWWEGKYDESTGRFTGQGVFSYVLPDGPPIQLLGSDLEPADPQVGGGCLTFTRPRPSASSPEELWEEPIYGMPLTPSGEQAGPIESLAESANSYIMGDATWVYDFSGRYLVWEQHKEANGFKAGSHLLDLASKKTTFLGPQSYRPSLSRDLVAFYQDGLVLYDISRGTRRTVDPEGDWPSLAETFVAYMRTDTTGGSSRWDIVVRSLDCSREEVLGTQSTPPWLSPAIAVSSHHVAFVDDNNEARLFRWEVG